ncbi:MAG TPA: transposase [Candidatus Acidoferrales bacterium]|jgi:putative transposase|nr:transposase [Candidatus Acidoferrales bacterium]
MARLPRIVAVNTAHHVTQRGNARQSILSGDAERMVYLELLQENLKLYQVSLLGYCLMSNHVHLIVVPHEAAALATALKQTHGRYASYWNAAHNSSGHVWQGRFYSCPLDTAHLWIALRYTELNPQRAKLVTEAAAWTWSSAAAHSALRQPPAWLDMEIWSERWSAESWREFLASSEPDDQLTAIRQCTHSGRPLGTPDFVHSLEKVALRRLAPEKGGRRRNRPAEPDPRQKVITFDH